MIWSNLVGINRNRRCSRGSGDETMDPSLEKKDWLYPVAPLGQLLREGDAIAGIVNAQGITRETVCAKQTCVVLAYPDKAWIARWLSICTIGVLET